MALGQFGKRATDSYRSVTGRLPVGYRSLNGLTHLLPSGRKSGKPPRETPEQDSEEAQIIEAYMSALAVIEQLKQPSQEEDAGADGKVSV